MAHRAFVVIAVAAVACKSKRHADPMPEPPLAGDARPAADAAKPWPELDGYPLTAPDRVIALPAKATAPRFEVGGPVIAGDVAVVASSQFGFIGVDWRRGTIAWTKPAGAHVAPPLVRSDGVVLIGECVNPPAIADGELLLGCLRVVTNTGTDRAYIAIRANPKAVEAFASAAGTQSLWPDGERVRWRRGDAAVTIDLVSGVAKPADATPPPVTVVYQDHRWDISHVDGRIIAREGSREAWSTKHQYTAMLGPVWLPDQSPMLRVANLGSYGYMPEVHLHDIDATGSLSGQSARPTPGIGLLGWGVSSYGDVALAVRLDTSLRRDFVAGYAANAALVWVYTLPEVPRADPVGIAIAPDAVVVFHDGDTLTVLPELSVPPTAPGGGRPASQIPTP